MKRAIWRRTSIFTTNSSKRIEVGGGAAGSAMNVRTLLLVLVGMAIIQTTWQGCTRPTLIGSDLLEDEVSQLGFTDTLDIIMTTVREDSVLVHSSQGGPQIVSHVCGHLDDPFFGTSSSEIFSQVYLTGVGRDILENTVDSVVLHLVYDTSGLYGDLTHQVSVEARRIFTDLDNTQDYYSNFSVSANLTAMGIKEQFVPRPFDSLEIIEGNDTVVVPPMLRIPLDQNFVNIMLQQTPATFEFNDSFRLWFEGLKISMNEGSNTMLGFDLNDPRSGMTVYMSDVGAGEFSQYRFAFRGQFVEQIVQPATFEHNYTGSVAEQFIGDSELTDSLVFIQSMSGLNAEFGISGLDNLDDVLINQAELEIYMAEIPDNDTTMYPPIDRLSVQKMNEDGNIVISEDVRQALRVDEIRVFGGNSVATDSSGITPRKYVMNITISVQDILQGRAVNQLFLSSFAKPNKASRVILYGPGHSQYPARLRLTYTKVR